LELWTVQGPIRSGLASALESHPDVKAILMGTRRSDPYAANLQAFQVCCSPLPISLNSHHAPLSSEAR
jgi:FAD synthetase